VLGHRKGRCLVGEKMWWEVTNWIKMAHDRDKWRPGVKTVMSFGVQ